ncbi:hypothetical protein U9M48_028871 [Paspalum notatum var. saurae]|uniref:Staygreen protein domain-containing protein n=1 Tax=Paspalum notatum var. saurae TaxID=547442 RepID=A0AAQ3U1Z8_PASNO
MAASRFFSSSVAVTSGRSSKRMMAMGGCRPPKLPRFLVVSCSGGTTTRTTAADVYSSLAAKVLGPPTSFNAAKLKVEFAFAGEYSFPRAYTLTHCDLTANLTLAVTSGPMSSEQLRSWQSTLQRDDVVAEWKEAATGTGEMSLHVHCFVSGANLLQELAAGFRYYVFSKELPLVLQAVVHGDAALFAERPELMEAKVWVHFHSSSRKYNRIECWGPLRDAATGTGTAGGTQTQLVRVRNHHHSHLNNLLDLDKLNNNHRRRRRRPSTNKWASPETIFSALLALLL